MKLDLSEILTHVGMRYTYPVDEPPIVDEDIECAAPVEGKITFTNTGSVLLIEGMVDSTVVLPCSRCLAYFEQPVHVDIEEQFPLEARAVGPRAGRQTPAVVEEEETPETGKLFEGPLLDLTELLRQGITLALPSQPLHDEACKGLCAQCGCDMNETACDCVQTRINPAFAKLGALLENKDKEAEQQGSS